MTIAQAQDCLARHPRLPDPRGHQDRDGQGRRHDRRSGSRRSGSRSNSRPRPSRSSSGSTRATSSSRKSRFPKDLDELLYQLKSDDVIGRMDAAAALLKFKDEARTVPALAASVKADPFWAVRKASLESLAKLAGPGAAAVLTQVCKDPTFGRSDGGGPGPGRPQGQRPDRVLQGTVQDGREPEGPDRGCPLARQDGRRIARPVPEAGGRRPLAAEHDQAGGRGGPQAARSEVRGRVNASSGWASRRGRRCSGRACRPPAPRREGGRPCRRRPRPAAHCTGNARRSRRRA